MKKTLFLLLFPFALFSQRSIQTLALEGVGEFIKPKPYENLSKPRKVYKELASVVDTLPIDTIPEPPIVVNPPTPIPNGLAKDTIYSKVIDGYFYIVRRNVQDNGSYAETSEFVGDTTALIDRAEGIIVQNSDVLYKSALLVLSSAKYWDQAIRDDQLLTFAYGQSPLTQIQQSYDGQFLSGVWAMQTAQGTQQIGFARDAVGKLKLTVAEEEKTVHLVGNCMRIEGLFPTGPVNLYKVSQGLWVNTEKTIAIKQVQ